MLWVLPAAFLVIAGLLGSAQSPVPPGQISMTAFALDERTGEPQNLVPADIEVRGIPAKPVAVERLTGPRRVIFLLDLSSSIRSTAIRWENTLDTLGEFLRRYGSDDSLALHAFAEKHRILVPLSQDSSEIQKQLQLLRLETAASRAKEYGRQSEVTRALQQSLEETQPGLRLGDAIVLVSDGQFAPINASALEKIQMELCERSVRLCVLRTSETAQGPSTTLGAPGLPTRDRNTMVFQGYLANQQMLVSPVGGIVLSPHKPRFLSSQSDSDRKFDAERIATASRALASFIRNAWRIDLQIQESLSKPRRISLQYRNNGSARGNRVEILHPQWILPAGNGR